MQDQSNDQKPDTRSDDTAGLESYERPVARRPLGVPHQAGHSFDDFEPRACDPIALGL